ncbi:MAG: MFS transporter [Alphaproteobacteria bacterium]
MTATTQNSAITNPILLQAVVLVTSLGYFVDMFDMFLFNMLRVKSLSDLGLSGEALTDAGLFISSCQFGGLLIGAYTAGVLGDRYGRKKALYVSIILYAIGSLASAFVMHVPFYGLARFVTGFGLAGELGAGVTLIAEGLAPAKRGYGIMAFIVMGFFGVLAAALVAEFVPWRTAYLIGGLGGLLLLFTRVLLSESGMYLGMAGQNIVRGGIRLILCNPALFKTWICAIFLMAPSVFIPQILWTLSPELSKAMDISGAVKPNIILGIGYSSVILGDLMAIALSERLQSRRKAALVFLMLGSAVFLKYLVWPANTVNEFYVLNGLLGMTFGVWVIGATWAAEQFGTNIRATAVTTIPNFARGLTIPMNMAYAHLKILGPLAAAGIIGLIIFTLAWVGWRNLRETYGRDLAFSES